MTNEQREIGVIEITTEQLNAVSGGAVVSADDILAFRNAMIEGFCNAGGSTSINSNGGLDWHVGKNTVHS